MSDEEHIIICGCIELGFAIVKLMCEVYPAFWVLFALSIATITLGGILKRKRRKKNE